MHEGTLGHVLATDGVGGVLSWSNGKLACQDLRFELIGCVA